jgi:hypothetical protein
MKRTRPTAEQKRAALEWCVSLFNANREVLSRDGSKHLNDIYIRELFAAFLAKDGMEGMCEALAPHVELVRRGKQIDFNLFEVAALFIERGYPLPESMREFFAEFLRKQHQGGPGPQGSDLKWRNHMIGGAIRHVAEMLKIPKMGRSEKHQSAASIVREALSTGAGVNLGEEAINDIAKKYGRFRGNK